MRIVRFASLVLSSLLFLAHPPVLVHGQDPGGSGVLRGQVLSAREFEPVAGARITVSLARTLADVPEEEIAGVIELTSDTLGGFSTEIDASVLELTVEAFGFEPFTRGNIRVRAGQTTEVEILLEAVPFRLDEIVVMPSTFGMLRDQVVPGQILSRRELDAKPHFGNDIFRAVAQVPGVTAFDHSAAPYVRGARVEEVLTILDGLELYEPYHLKQWDGSLSIVDVENVQDVNLTTGGFTTEFGDASTGVFSMRTATPRVDGMQTTVGLDFMTSILKNEGTFDEGKGSWVFSARRGFLDLIFELTGLNDEEDLHPSYYDIYAKGEYRLSPKHEVSVHVLHAGDDNHGVENDSTVYHHRFGSSYAWANWTADLTRETSVRTMFSVGRVWRDRNGTQFYFPGSRPQLEVRDQGIFDFFGLRQDWKHAVSQDLMVKAGLDAKWGQADYDYFRYEEVFIPNTTDPSKPDFPPSLDNLRLATRPDGYEVGAYLAGRIQPLEGLTVEGGLRYDRQSHTGEQQLAPRLNAAYELAPRTNLRAAWGHYHQSQGLHQMWAGDGDDTFFPAQRAEHRVLGMEHTTESGLTLRAEAYQRLLSNPLPEYRNLEDHSEGLKEEGPGDRFFIQAAAGRAKGIELFAKSSVESKFSWAASYALSKAEEKIDGEWVPRPFDQRHAVNLLVTARPTPSWSISLAWIYHSPWPFTDQIFSVEQTVRGYGFVTREFGPMNQERLIPYERLDLRISKNFPLRRGNLIAYLDVFNVTNRENAQSADFQVGIGESGLITTQTINPMLEVMPSLGLRWVF